jgi:ABC-type transporter Mla subunit MlaD
MGRSGIYLRVGLLIVGGVALLIALLWFLGGNQIRHGTLYESYFSESVQGLEVGANVKYLGVTIGRVTEIGLVSAEYGGNGALSPEQETSRLVFVRFEVDASRIGRVPDTQTAVALGLRVKLASQGITGLSYLELDFVNAARYPPLQVPWRPTAEYIPSVPSTFAQVQDAAQQLLAKLNGLDLEGISTQLSALVGDLRAELKSGDLHDTLTEATALLRTTRQMVQAVDLPGMTAEIKQAAGSVRDTMQGERMQKLLANAALAIERFATVSSQLPALIASIQATSRRAGNGTADIEQSLVPLLRDMQATVQNLREATESLRRYPAQVFGQPPPRSEPAR